MLREAGGPRAPGGSSPKRTGSWSQSARASGTRVDAEVTGPLESLPGPVPARVRVRVEASGGALVLEVRNALPASGTEAGRGSGLRGIRERAALLGGRACTGLAPG